MPVIDHSTFIKLRLVIDLSLSNIYIDLLLGHNLKGSQIYTVNILGTKISVIN